MPFIGVKTPSKTAELGGMGRGQDVGPPTLLRHVIERLLDAGLVERADLLGRDHHGRATTTAAYHGSCGVPYRLRESVRNPFPPQSSSSALCWAVVRSCEATTFWEVSVMVSSFFASVSVTRS